MKVYRTLSSNFSWARDDLEWPVTSEVGPGLSGVIATGTRVSWLDPSSGTLEYRGVPIERLAGLHSYEEIAHLLITGELAQNDCEAFAAFRDQLRASRDLPEDVVSLIRSLDPGIHPTRVLRAGSATADRLSGSVKPGAVTPIPSRGGRAGARGPNRARRRGSSRAPIATRRSARSGRRVAPSEPSERRAGQTGPRHR